MTTRAARERIAKIRAMGNLQWSDGHIAYNAHMMNFIADKNDREERAIVAGFRRLRAQQNNPSTMQSRNIVLAEGEPTPRHQAYLKRMSANAVRDRNPISQLSADSSDINRGRAAPQSSQRRLQRQFTARKNRGGNGSSSARSDWSALSSLDSGFDSFRSIHSDASDISISDVEALELQRLKLEAHIRNLDSDMALRAASPKMQGRSMAHGRIPRTSRSLRSNESSLATARSRTGRMSRPPLSRLGSARSRSSRGSAENTDRLMDRLAASLDRPPSHRQGGR